MLFWTENPSLLPETSPDGSSITLLTLLIPDSSPVSSKASRCLTHTPHAATGLFA